MLLTLMVVGLAAQFFPETLAQCDLLTPKATGSAVVQQVVDKIGQSGIFPNDHKFLCRIAFVESKFGEDKGTFRTNYNGGIWQVDKGSFDETVHQPGLKKYRDQIKAKWGIEWTKVKWEDLKKPFYSALAARMHLAKFEEAIPAEIPAQARYWKKYYNSYHKNAGGTVEKFIEDLKSARGCAR